MGGTGGPAGELGAVAVTGGDGAAGVAAELLAEESGEIAAEAGGAEAADETGSGRSGFASPPVISLGVSTLMVALSLGGSTLMMPASLPEGSDLAVSEAGSAGPDLAAFIAPVSDRDASRDVSSWFAAGVNCSVFG